MRVFEQQLSDAPYLIKQTAERIGYLAYLSLLEELYTSPKPGLVDLYSTGTHKDMDYKTFECGAEAIRPYFVYMSCQGMLMANCPRTLFLSIRTIGMAAEKAMYRATGGKNTHKGLIFSLGIMCAAAGACMRKWGRITVERLFFIEQKMVKHILIKEIMEIRKGDGKSNGEKNMLMYGNLGARGEAINGYNFVRSTSLPIMIRGVREEKNWNLVKLETLLSLMSQVEDSNIIARHNPEVLKDVQAAAEIFMKAGGAYRVNAVSSLKRMDHIFTVNNISAAGCADLLALTIFLFMILYCLGETGAPALSQK